MLEDLENYLAHRLCHWREIKETWSVLGGVCGRGDDVQMWTNVEARCPSVINTPVAIIFLDPTAASARMVTMVTAPTAKVCRNYLPPVGPNSSHTRQLLMLLEIV